MLCYTCLVVSLLLLCHQGFTGANIRLIGSANGQEGTVEIMYQGIWGTICNDGWDDIDATVVCRQLGFLNGITTKTLFTSLISSGPVWIRQVECLGNESKLLQCPHIEFESFGNCSHAQDVQVKCNGIKVEPIPNGTLRLSRSNSSYVEVEIFINEQWVTVCDDGWDDIIAGVVCRQLGFGSSGKIQQFLSSGSGKIIKIPNFFCSGNESTLLGCSHREMEISDCDDSGDVEITCTGPTQALPIRLADGSTFPFSGRVEIYHNGVWNTVCDKNWTDRNTQVVCRQLGYGYSSAITDHNVPAGKGPILLDNVNCSGNETNLLACSHNGLGNHNCGHVQDVGVTCFPLLHYPSIRLVGGSSYNEGRVEVSYNGEWGTVCDDGWDDIDAGVVCRQLGFGSSGLAVYSSSFGEGSGPIWLNNVICTGNEPILAKCGHLGINIVRLCDHSRDAGVKCLGGQGTLVRLVGGSLYNEGRVEVNYNGEWGTVCDDEWDDIDADVVCRQLGLGSSGIAIGSAGFGQGSGSIWLSGVTCTGNESTIASCGHLGINTTTDCYHNEDAGVKCSKGHVTHYFLGFFVNYAELMGSHVSILLTTTEVYPVPYFIEAPVVGYYRKGIVSAGDEVIFNLPNNVEVSSYDGQNKGIYLITSSRNITVIGQSLDRGTGDTFFVLPITELDDVYTYYGISVPRASHLGILNSSILVVGTKNNTMMYLTTTQPVNVSFGTSSVHLIPGRQHSLVINRLQTIYIGSLDDLSGTKIVTDRPVSVFSGHECGNVPHNVLYCNYLIEQIPPTALWGKIYYTAPLAGKKSYTIKIIAAFDSTIVNMYCNTTIKLFAIDKGNYFNATLQRKEYCAIYSNKKILVVQLSHGGTEDAKYGDPMMTLVPAKNQYSNKFDAVTIHNTLKPDYNHYINVIVMSQYYQPNMIFLIAGKVNRSLDTEQWVPIQVNNITEAYATQVRIPEGIAHIVHTNVFAQMMTIVYGFTKFDGYGHSGGIRNHIERYQTCTVAGVIIVRLVGGSLYNEGRVEVKYNGEWGTVCDDGWDDIDAGVVCRQLGFGLSGTAIGSAGFDQGSGSIWLSNVTCTGNESTLASCGHLGVSITRNCGHFKDAGVRCSGNKPLMRLIGGSSYNEGRVEVNYNGEWGTVCDDGWDSTDAGVVCRQLGFGSSGTAIGSAGFGQGSGSIWINGVTCTSDELTLASCGHLGVGITGNCNHSEDAGVRCSGDVQPIFYIHPMDRIVEISSISTSIVLTCMAYGAESYYWLRENQKIQSHTMENNVTGNLLLVNITPSDSGHYQCVAENSFGRRNSNYAKLIVNALPPVVTIFPKLINTKKGGNAKFSCTATGVGAANFEYQWFLNQLLISHQNTSTLIINAVTNVDSGDYACSVRNPYKGIGHSEIAKLFISDQSCQSVTISYQEFNITWNDTLAGDTVEAPCMGHGLSGVVHRRCIRDNEWEEYFGCFRKEAEVLFNQAINLTLLTNVSSQNDTITKASDIAAMLANLTAPTSEPLYAEEIDLAVTIVSALNNVTEKTVMDTDLVVNSTFFEDTARIFDNLLSDKNQKSWEQLERTSPATSKALVGGVEQYSKLLSTTLTNDTNKVIKDKSNIVIKAEYLSKENTSKEYSFPDEDDGLTNYRGESTHLMIPRSLLETTFSMGSTEFIITNTLIKNGLALRLPTFGNGTTSPPVLASSIFSLQMDPVPNSSTLERNPIMMMFNVQPPPLITSPEKSSIQNSDFTLQDVSCSFYDYTLTTDNFNQDGGWSTKGLIVDKSQSNRTTVTCLTTHLTSFAVLVSIQEGQPPTPADKALSLISYIGCSISLICLSISIVILIIVIFKTREKTNYLLIHLNLCIALALGLVVFISGIETATDNEVSCKIVAALLQYLFISAFCWMLCEGVMLFMTLVTVYGNRFNQWYFFFILGWGPAIPIVTISVGSAHEHYGTDHYCWIRSDKGAIAAFIVPIVAIMLINCVFLLITLKVIWTSKQQSSNANNKDTVKHLIKAVIILLPVLGLTWIIGILAVNNDTEVFAWIFAILNSLQGVFILIFHVLRNKLIVKEIRLQYHLMRKRRSFRRQYLARHSGNICTSIAEATSKKKVSASEVSNYNMKVLTTSTGSYTAVLSKASIEDSVLKDEDQINLNALNELVIEYSDTGNKEIGSIKGNHDVGTQEIKSITEEEISVIVAEKFGTTIVEPDSLSCNEK